MFNSLHLKVDTRLILSAANRIHRVRWHLRHPDRSRCSQGLACCLGLCRMAGLFRGTVVYCRPWKRSLPCGPTHVSLVAKPHGEAKVILRTDTRAGKRFLALQSIPTRRRYPRIEKPHGVWVYWHCQGRENTSQVRDLSTAGLFVETEEVWEVDATIRVDFLVQEGQIRAKAVVRHVKPGCGLGLKFIALTAEDGPRLTALMTRLRS